MPSTPRRITTTLFAAAAALILAGTSVPAMPAAEATDVPAGAQPGVLQDCEALADFAFENTVITSAETVPSGELTNRGEPIGEHCKVTGHMNERVSPVDQQTYRIGFEMRLPKDWNGRYLYQANGGLDGTVVPALGTVGGGESGLQMGMAVISSDAGHSSAQNPTFGVDPQARLDYGYQAVGALTPMAKSLVEAGYGRGPDYSYMTGGSNGGRHTMVGASRYADEYDGFLAVAPGFNLPQAAVAQVWGAQQWATVADGTDLKTALTQDERQVVADAILSRCDRLDGLEDGMVQASERCQKVFRFERDVPTCDAERDGTCLTAEQKDVVAKVFSGAETSTGESIYSSFPYDPGLTQAGWGNWKFDAPLTRDSSAYGYIFSTPPDAPALETLPDYALNLDIDQAARSIHQSDGTYTESAMEFMTPPDLDRMDSLQAEGGKLMVIHGAADGVFSVNDTASWYERLDKANKNKAEDFARYFEVPGMGHVRGGVATDQYDALASLVGWVEQGSAPQQLTAWVNPANTELPADWSTERSRPLCVYPATARYQSGDPESASSFRCTGDKPQKADR